MSSIRAARQRRRKPTASDMHRSWLELVAADGPFLAVPALKKAWPNGMPTMKASAQGRAALQAMRPRKERFEAAWDKWRHAADDNDGTAPQDALAQFRGERDQWVRFVLRDMLDWRDDYRSLAPGMATAERYRVSSPNGAVGAVPSGILSINGKDAALVLVVDPVDGTLADMPGDGWNASALDRMQRMLRTPGSDMSVGVVTDGRWWAIVSAPLGTPGAWGQFDSQMWVDTPEVRDAFATLLSVPALASDEEEKRLPALFADSQMAAEEITEALGTQVRNAVELLVASFSDQSAQARAAGLSDPLPADGEEIYEAAVSVMMRVVFLLFAQERGLLPQSALFEDGYGLLGVLDELEARATDEGEEAMDGTSMTWHRLLATSQAMYSGANFEDMRLPAYGGSIFDESRHPFLVATDDNGELRINVSDLVMLRVLQAVQIAIVDNEARRISFRDIDVEQIGYIYEGLLGYTCARADQVVLGVAGRAGQEPEIPLDVLEDIARRQDPDPKGTKRAKAIIEWVRKSGQDAVPPTAGKIAGELAGDLPDDAERMLLAISDDTDLRARILPWIALVRRDLRGKPVVFQPGDLYVRETSSRASAGAHYTPRSLAEDVVVHALEPLVYQPGPYQSADRSRWKRLSSDEILNLKVADIACGSGAFLVAAARYLADELVQAWRDEGEGGRETAEQMRRRAIRKVVASCLYGVDINEMAVEMCKLSLWLVSLDPHQPFSFVDNKILHGNSLLGVTNLEQVSNERIDGKPQHQQLLFEDSEGDELIGQVDVGAVIRRIRPLREQLAQDIDDNDPQRSGTAKRRQMRTLHDAVAQVRAIADGVIAAGLSVDGKPGRQLDDAYDKLAIAVARAFPANGHGDDTMLRTITRNGLTPTVPTDYEQWRCVHWPLDVPEVMENGGFDAIIGNPPFLGGQKITGAMGTNMREWFINVLAGGKKGSADLCAYFFLHAFRLLRQGGTLGLLATNTIAQGDTREAGLDSMVANGFTIMRSIQSRPWPVKSANLEYAAIWGTKSQVPQQIARNCDGTAVRGISTLLEPQGRATGAPSRLEENRDIAFIGCYVLGEGFIISPEQAAQWIAADPRNSEVVFPYLNGKDMNSRPDCSPSRWVVDFNDRSEKEASEYYLPYQHILEHVKPYRQRKKADGSYVILETRAVRWWLYAAAAPSMRKAIANLDEVLCIVRVSKTVMPVRVPTTSVFSDSLVVYATDSFIDQAVLSSAPHQLWAITRGSGMRGDPRYTPSDVFETFPRPEGNDALERIGRVLEEERREIMLRRGLGLTDLYNLVNNPDIADGRDADVARMRAIHRELDETVMAAYGWDDIELGHGFHEYRKMTRWTVCPAARVEILDRLLEENQRRAGVRQVQDSDVKEQQG